MPKIGLIFFCIYSFLFGWEYYYHGHLEQLTPISQTTRNLSLIRFVTKRGQIVGVDHRIIIRPKNKACKDSILQSYSNYYELGSGDIVLFVDNPKEAFEESKKIYESGCALYAHPDFLVHPKKRNFDPLFNPLQWNLYNYGQYYSVPDIDINVYEAWRYATGKGVKVAILDNGFDLLHPDLKEAFVDQIDLVDFDNDASYDNNYELHGTACAGLIAARKNGIGMQGIAYDASLIGIKLIGSYADGSDRALYVSTIVQAFLYAKEAGAQVINCSWGTYNVADAVRYVINDLAHNGRNGKGIPIVFASGNEGREQWYWANDESALDSVIAVGAIDNYGEHPWYSNYGPTLDFVAPSGGGSVAITTTDITGSLGYADGSYGHPDYCYATDMSGFNGTSAAAPQVAAVIALMLERNPELTRDEIVDILRRTAKKVGGGYYDGHSDYYGYGLVDAEAAVKEAIRLKVERDIANKSYPLQGFFVRVGNDKFDWIYVTWDRKYAFKLEGMDEKSGKLLWQRLYFESIDVSNDMVFFGEAAQGYATTIALKEFPINGYFVHFDNGAYDWIYIDRVLHQSFKLEKLNYDGSFLWVPLHVVPTINNREAIF